MQVSTTTLQPIFEGVKQYIVPLFQRPYCWDKKEWTALWEDLYDLYQSGNPHSHFLGSIVTIPTQTVPEGVAKWLLIDGQQRMTTFYLILMAIKTIANERNENDYADEIYDTLLVNKWKRGQLDYFKMLPTQGDRERLMNLVRGVPRDMKEVGISSCYQYFYLQIKKHVIDLNKLNAILTTKLSLVSIVLDQKDDPYVVFESLNYKGKPLSSADLIRNYFFMKIHVDKQDQVYQEIWKPMQDELSGELPEFVRHFLMKDGEFIRNADVYMLLKEEINKSEDVIEYMEKLRNYSSCYAKLLNPDLENDLKLRKQLKILRRLEMATCYTYLLNVYNDYEEDVIDSGTFCEIIDILENYACRRFVCGIPTNQLNKVFPIVYKQTKQMLQLSYAERLKVVLFNKNYPKDWEFKSKLQSVTLYGSGKEKFGRTILERIEQSFDHKEPAALESLQIEHVMVQTLTPEWEIHLGEDHAQTHEIYLHTLGNLTLTGYNPELSNSDFFRKKSIYRESNLGLNKYFEHIERWGEDEILTRAEVLSDIVAGQIYPYFGTIQNDENPTNGVTGTKPKSIEILGDCFQCSTWHDVLFQTLSYFSELEPEKLDNLAQEYPSLIGKEDVFQRGRSLSNGYYYEAKLSAKSIYAYCSQIMSVLGLEEDDWKVSY